MPFIVTRLKVIHSHGDLYAEFITICNGMVHAITRGVSWEIIYEHLNNSFNLDFKRSDRLLGELLVETLPFKGRLRDLAYPY